MATFEGEVTQTGWRVKIETNEASEDCASVHGIAHTFIQSQVALQAEAHRFIREAIGTEGAGFYPTGVPQAPRNGQSHYDTEEAETLSD